VALQEKAAGMWAGKSYWIITKAELKHNAELLEK
jgi:hypothetical protein